MPMQIPPPHEFVNQLRAALTEHQRILELSEGRAMGSVCGTLLMDHMIDMVEILANDQAPWPGENVRQGMTRCQVFGDIWALPDDNRLTRLVEGVTFGFLRMTTRPPLPDGRVLDEAAEAAIAAYRAWRPGYEEAKRQEALAWEAKVNPAARPMPHNPDPDALDDVRLYANSVIYACEDPVNTAWIAHPTSSQQQDFANAFLARGLIHHWLRRDPTQVRSDLSSAAERMALALPTVQIHAWEYEQWQHLAIVVAHRGLLDALWALRREEWDTNRIRPVNWLICRIRILDLLHQGGSEAELRGLLEMSWIGLFADPLPPELAVDTPLMRNWHELLRAILDRDTVAFDRHLVLRQVQLAAHWTRGGGIAPLSLADLGGLALVRTARARGLTPATPGLPYLAFDLLFS